ncbi:P-loop containing nucleoside triphosphate hydrolase protein, partial [Roridomyces roridus]
IYETEAGFTLVQDILYDALPYKPHDYTIWGIVAALDGNDLVAVTPTGSGKTTFLLGMTLALRELAAHPDKCLSNRTFPKNPLLLCVSPTLALQRETCKRFTDLKIDCLVINSDTLSEAAKVNQNLWEVAAEGPSVIVLSPEQLRTEGFDALQAKIAFNKRLCVLGIDELHLLFHWGKALRPSFVHIGQARFRLRPRDGRPLPLIGLSASVHAGKPWETIRDSLGLQSPTFRLI